MKIMIGGDFSPTEYNKGLFENGKLEELYGAELLEYLRSFDYRIFDFESVFDTGRKRINKYGPYITASVESIKGIVGVRPDVMILANNHSNNFGAEGLADTIKVFEENGIRCVGAGGNREEARLALHLRDDVVDVAIYACTNHEFNIFEPTSTCMNIFDPVESYNDVKREKENSDQVIVIYHGGRIGQRYPSAYEQKILRGFVDAGADLVIMQHTHCIGCREVYKNKTIIYGQGDFLFARPTKTEDRKTGLLVEVDVSKAGLGISYEVRIKPENTIRLGSVMEKESVLQEFERQSGEIEKTDFVKEEYKKFLRDSQSLYLSILLGRTKRNYLFRLVNKLSQRKFAGNFVRSRYSKEDILQLINYLECESHREVFLDILKGFVETYD